MNIVPDKKSKEDLVEVIYATLDGNIYFSTSTTASRPATRSRSAPPSRARHASTRAATRCSMSARAMKTAPPGHRLSGFQPDRPVAAALQGLPLRSVLPQILECLRLVPDF
jgi:hypothetical protein